MSSHIKLTVTVEWEGEMSRCMSVDVSVQVLVGGYVGDCVSRSKLYQQNI